MTHGWLWFVLGCRNTEAGENAIAALRASGIKSGTVECLKLDTASLASVRSFARKVVAAHPLIHVLVNNGNCYCRPFIAYVRKSIFSEPVFKKTMLFCFNLQLASCLCHSLSQKMGLNLIKL